MLSSPRRPDTKITLALIQVEISGILAKNQSPISAVQINLRKSKGIKAVGSVSLNAWLNNVCGEHCHISWDLSLALGSRC